MADSLKPATLDCSDANSVSRIVSATSEAECIPSVAQEHSGISALSKHTLHSGHTQLKLRDRRSSSTKTFDITNSLRSFQFSLDHQPRGGYDENSTQMENLRARAHAITVAQCAQAIHVVYTFNKARKLMAYSKQKLKKTHQFTGEQMAEDPMKVGIIGCGRVGCQLATLLLKFARMYPNDLFISTRRPQMLGSFTEKGVVCFHDNLRLVNTVDIAFICVLPGQLDVLAAEVKSQIPETCIIYSYASTIRPKRLRIMLDHRNVVVPEYSWEGDNVDNPWDYSIGVGMALEVKHMVDLTCPLSGYKREAIIVTSPRLVDATIYAFCNMCTASHYNRSTILKLLNLVMFGVDELSQMDSDNQDVFREKDITRRLKKPDSTFPLFDLSTVTYAETPAIEKIKMNEKLRQMFRHEYQELFVMAVGKNRILLSHKLDIT